LASSVEVPRSIAEEVQIKEVKEEEEDDVRLFKWKILKWIPINSKKTLGWKGSCIIININKTTITTGQDT